MGRAAGIVIVTAVLAVLAPGRFGHDKPKSGGPLRWETPARVSEMAGTAGDHLLFGRLVNHSSRTIRLRASRVRVLDRKGHAMRTVAAFADGFVPGVTLQGYGAELYGSDAVGDVGREVVLRTGQSAPLTLSFSSGDDRPAAAVDYGDGTLKLGR